MNAWTVRSINARAESASAALLRAGGYNRVKLGDRGAKRPNCAPLPPQSGHGTGRCSRKTG